MFNLKVTLTTYEFDAEAYNKALRVYVEKQSRLAAVEFAKAALARIPIRTGFVAGAFGTLLELLGSNASFNPIVRATIARSPEYYYPGFGGRIEKTPVSGRQFSTPAQEIFKWQGDNFVFTYDIDISYFRINDLSGGFSPTAPWRAFEAGQVAFEQFLSKNFDDAPNPGDFFIAKTQTFG